MPSKGRPRGASFAHWLKVTMLNADVKAKDLAVHVGVSEGAMSKWVSGKSRPRPDDVIKIADYFDVDRLRLLVTAGRVPHETGIDPLPMPPETMRRSRAREDLLKSPWLTEEERERMLEVFDRMAPNDDRTAPNET
ncbi:MULTISPECIES: helix-turn-helix domain-containing protein [unclassified Streptomyces]|uniref:helix-turn-helix domain-containing protein n=1 Tax=unclassified Streptomyces TaxID=2593676 RepID=UPI00380E9A75